MTLACGDVIERVLRTAHGWDHSFTCACGLVKASVLPSDRHNVEHIKFSLEEMHKDAEARVAHV